MMGHCIIDELTTGLVSRVGPIDVTRRLGFLCSSSICMKGSSPFRLFSIHNSTVPQGNSHFCPLAESSLGEHDITETSGLLRNLLLGREAVFLNSKLGHNPESRMAVIWGGPERVCMNRAGGTLQIGFHSVKHMACGREIRPVDEEQKHPGQILPSIPSRA